LAATLLVHALADKTHRSLALLTLQLAVSVTVKLLKHSLTKLLLQLGSVPVLLSLGASSVTGTLGTLGLTALPSRGERLAPLVGVELPVPVLVKLLQDLLPRRSTSARLVALGSTRTRTFTGTLRPSRLASAFRRSSLARTFRSFSALTGTFRSLSFARTLWSLSFACTLRSPSFASSFGSLWTVAFAFSAPLLERLAGGLSFLPGQPTVTVGVELLNQLLDQLAQRSIGGWLGTITFVRHDKGCEK
jgi:hypothetical protein